MAKTAAAAETKIYRSRDVFKQGPAMLGTLMASSGFGALSAALFLASRRDTEGLLRLVIAAGMTLGGSLLVFAVSKVLWLAFILLFLIGFCFLMVTAASNTLLQSAVEENKRGRVMSFFTMAFTGTMPLASLLSGAAASYFGPRLTLAGAALLCLAGASAFSAAQRKTV